MPIKSYKLGDGTLKLGEAGVQDVSCQVTNCRVEWSEQVTSTDDVDALCGETLKGEEEATYTANLAGNLVQDIDAAGAVAWSWDNKGTQVPVEFVPSTVAGRKVTGTVRIVPINLGGDVKTRPRSDFTWKFTTDPVLDDIVAP